jgi:hypothetical protein
VAQQPVKPRADHNHHISFFQHKRARRTGRKFMCIRQQTLGHAHREIGNTTGFNEFSHHIVGLGISGTFTEDDQRFFSALDYIKSPLYRRSRGDLGRGWINHLDQ